MKLFNRLKKNVTERISKSLNKGLAKTSKALTSNLKEAILPLSGQKISPETLENLEDSLLLADVPLPTVTTLLEPLKNKRFTENLTLTALTTALEPAITTLLTPLEVPLTLPPKAEITTPLVIFMVGVNGSGKTTTTAKLAHLFQTQGYTVHLAAADTYRAGAVQQLQNWAERTNTSITLPKTNKTDPSALIYQSYEEAVAKNAHILLVDTAGRLQTRKDLMDELSKMTRTIKKHDPKAPHHTFLTLDATVGQNALSQLSAFQTATPLTGLILTKLDSSAKAGVILGLPTSTTAPIRYITTGETEEDMHTFYAKNFTHALLNLPPPS